MTELPAPPAGLPVVDKSLADERSRLLGRPKRGRARTAGPVPPDAMATYARKITSWTDKGYLARLMLRQQDQEDTESGE
jgi:hypothetical protein